MIEFFQNPENILTTVSIVITTIISVISIVFAAIALRQTKKQIELSNKQQLFDRRMNAYLSLKYMINSYPKQNFMLVPTGTIPYEEFDWALFSLVNNMDFLKIYNVFLELDSYENQGTIAIELSNKEKALEELKFVFPDNTFIYAYNFELNYIQTIRNIIAYKLKVMLDNKIDVSEQTKENAKWLMGLDDQKNLRQNVLNSFENLKITYTQMMENDIVSKMEEAIKLTNK